MKYCKTCGKELHDAAVMCPGCGCPVEEKASKEEKVSYDSVVKGAATTNIISIIVLIIGIVAALFINAWLGIVMCLVAELIALTTNTKVQKLFKKNNANNSDKKKLKEDEKKVRRELKGKNSAYSASFVIAYIALICLIVFAVWSQLI